MTIAFTKVALPYGWLGNMSAYKVELFGTKWRTAEHAFQALRLPIGHPLRNTMNSIPSPMGVKMAVKPYRAEFVIEPCSEDDIELMRWVTEEKLKQNGLQDELRATGDQLIVEDVSARPRGNSLFWGAARNGDDWMGENWLGKIWMEHRANLLFS